MNGTVKFWNDARRLGRVFGDNGQMYLALAGSVQPDGIGRRYLIDGEAVSFDDDRQSKTRTTRLAVNVTFDPREPLNVGEDYRERSAWW